MQKRGQIYLLVALIMSVIVFGMVTVSNIARQESIESDFEELSDNYAIESAKLINSLIGKDDIISSFRNFTLLFTSYAKTQNQKYELIYSLDYNNTLYVGNYLKNRIFICTDENCNTIYPPLEGCFSNIPATVSFDYLSLPIDVYESTIKGVCETNISSANINALYISINDLTYHFSIRKGRPELIIVSWEARDEQRKVYTGGEFVEGTTGGGPLMTLQRYCRETIECDPVYCNCDTREVLCPIISNKEECNANSLDCVWNEGLEKCVESTFVPFGEQPPLRPPGLPGGPKF